jgi:hypothetical protein
VTNSDHRRRINNRRGWHGINCKREFAELHLVVSQEKSRLTKLEEGFAFLGFEFRKSSWPDAVDVAAHQGVPQYSESA